VARIAEQTGKGRRRGAASLSSALKEKRRKDAVI
jgi:hypothetical protein